jgi:hypothetical protein
MSGAKIAKKTGMIGGKITNQFSIDGKSGVKNGMTILAQVDQVGNSISTWTQNNGLAVVLLFMVLISLGFAAWKTLNWSAANIVIPMRDSFISHLGRTDNTMEKMDKTMDTMGDTLTGLHDEMKATREIVTSKHDLINAKLDEIVKHKCQSL